MYVPETYRFGNYCNVGAESWPWEAGPGGGERPIGSDSKPKKKVQKHNSISLKYISFIF